MRILYTDLRQHRFCNFVHVYQFIYTTVIWGAVIGDKLGSSMIQMATFLMSLMGLMFLIYFEKHKHDDFNSNERKTFVKALPLVGMMWLLHSATTLCCVGMMAFDVLLTENTGGYITIIIFSTCFTCVWAQILWSYYILANKEYGESNRGGQSVWNRPDEL